MASVAIEQITIQGSEDDMETPITASGLVEQVNDDGSVTFLG
jgi:hypothetical protein